MTDPDAAGGGGEYEVVVGKSNPMELRYKPEKLIPEGFGWTNGVVLYLAGEYGEYLAPVSCPLIPIVEIEGYPGTNGTSGSGNGTSATNSTMEDGGVQNQTMTKVFAGYRIPRT